MREAEMPIEMFNFGRILIFFFPFQREFFEK
jgi:hypothetical protein